MESGVVMRTRGLASLVLSSLVLTTACGAGSGTTPVPATPPSPVLPPTRVSTDSTLSALVPPGLGTLRQDDISIVLNLEGVRVSALPLDESVIRVLAPDSYRTLHGTYESHRQQIIQRGQMHGAREPRVWQVSFYGLAPNARFVPTDFTVTSGGREYRPFDVIPLTSGFGTQRLQPRESQYGLLLFDEGLDVSQPVVVTVGAGRNSDWSNDPSTGQILTRVEAERANIRARARLTPAKP